MSTSLSSASGLIKSTINTTCSSIKTTVSTTMTSVSSNVSSISSTINEKIVSSVTTMHTKVKSKLKDVKSAFEDTFKDIKKSVSNIMDDLWKNIKTPINSIIGGVEKMANGIIKGINGAIKALNKIKFTVPSWVPDIGGKSVSFSIPSISTISIPRLAKGAVIPPNKEFMAILGDQKSGTNIETPLDTMIEAFTKALDSRGGNNQPIVLQLDSKVIAEVVWDESEKKYKQTGKPAFAY